MLTKKNSKKIIWISWESHRRTKNIAKALDIQLFEMVSDKSRWVKHPFFVLNTIKIINKYKPDVLIAQNPSIFLSLLSIFLRSVFRYKLVIDAHNAGLYPSHNILNKLLFIYNYIQRAADLTIVTNKMLCELVRKNGGRPALMPDKLPVFICDDLKRELKGNFNIVFICTFANDEPYIEVIESAKMLPDDFHIYITGNSKLCNAKIGTIKNLTLTGFLSENSYINLLKSSDVVMDLTTREDALLCGAYEAVALGVPMILSDTPVLKEFFYKGAAYTVNDAHTISQTIINTRKMYDKLFGDVNLLKNELNLRWNQYYEELINNLSDLLK